MSVDQSLVRQIHQQVGDQLQVEQSRRQAEGRGVLSGIHEEQFARKLIAEALTQDTAERINAEQPLLSHEDEDVLTEAVFSRIFGAGRLQRLLDDDAIENIDANGCDQVWITRAGQKAELGEPIAASDEELVELIQQLASYAGLSARAFDAANNELDLRLPDGSRLSALMSTTARPVLSIRRHRMSQATLEDLVANGTATEEVARFLSAAVKAKLNIMVGGATDSGKTTTVRALAAEIGPEERVITVENALELGLARNTERHPNAIEIEARPPNSEGLGEVTMAQMVRRSLRMNPDRVMVGEVLGPEVVVMLNAMGQGNDGSLSTIHARSAFEVISRIATYARQADGLDRSVAHEMIAGGLDVIVFMKQLPGGKRRVHTVLEITGFDSEVGVASSPVFAWDPVAGETVRQRDIQVMRAEELREVGWIAADQDAGGYGGWSQ